VTTHAVDRVALEFAPSSRPREHHPSVVRAPRVARQLALAHEIERRVRAGVFEDLAHAARAFGLTRARVTQLVNLTLLAPSIQAEILAMPLVTVGRDPINERTLRPIVAEIVWARQFQRWKQFHKDEARTRPNADC
jgi:hypothetical protein